MAALYRKSGNLPDSAHQEDTEQTRQRRRLSKPLTNTSTPNTPSLLSQLSTRRKSLGGSICTDSYPPSANASREALRSHLFGSTSDLNLKSSPPKQSAVALMISKFENNGSQPALTAPSTGSQRPLSHLVNALRAPESHKPSISSLNSEEKLDCADLSTISAASSVEQVVGDLAPPPKRVASFQPGAATRKSDTIPGSIDKIPKLKPEVVAHEITENSVKDSTIDGTEDWVLPPRVDRCSTPADLDYTHLGNLSLGSLHIVNGRASPAPIDVLNQFKTHPSHKLTRNASSVYESDFGTVKSKGTVKSRLGIDSEWEDADVTEPDKDALANSLVDIHRAFSFKPGSEAKFNLPTDNTTAANGPEIVDNSFTPVDQTTMLAEEYMAEIATSPYASTEAESLYDTDHEGGAAKDKESSFIEQSNVVFPSITCPTELAMPPIEHRHESPISFVSTHDTDTSHDEKFVSPAELQLPRTPRRSDDGSVIRQTVHSRALLTAQGSSIKTDSGYGSTTSLNAIISPDHIKNLVKASGPSKEKRLEIRFPFRKAGHNGKGVVVRPTVSTNIPIPISAEIEQASVTASSTSPPPRSPFKMFSSSQPSSPAKSTEKPRRKLVKQRRKSTADVPKQPVVQRLASIECFNIPPVSSTARKSLANRSAILPELEQTYRSQNSDSSNNQSVLSLSAPKAEIRFPSPSPEEKRSRKPSFSRSRSLSKSRPVADHRPKSWFGRQKDEDHYARQKSSAKDIQHVKLNDLGSVVRTLGNNPYDIAYGVQQPWSHRPEMPRSRASPSGISYDNRPRSMMDDQTASKLSKLRRKSMTDRPNTKRHSFDDRGGIPGRMPHFTRLSIDAPPLPPLPSPEEINKRLSFRQSLLGQPDPLHYQDVYHDDSVSMKEPTEPPPPPPTHSPRPQYVEQAVEDTEDIPPPPPCHSPRPIDITAQVDATDDDDDDDAWSAQANAWRERRMSASEALKRTWHEDYSSRDRPASRQAEAYTQTEGPTFSIPRKPLRRSMQTNEYAWEDSEQHQRDQDPQNHEYSNATYQRPSPTHPQHHYMPQRDDYQYAEYVQPPRQTHTLTSNLFHDGHVSSPFHYYHERQQPQQQHYHSTTTSQPQSRPRSRSNSRAGSRSNSRPRSQQEYIPQLYPDHLRQTQVYSHSASSTPRPNRHSPNVQYNYDRYSNDFRPQANTYNGSASSLRHEQQRSFTNEVGNARNWLEMDSYGMDTAYPKRLAMAAHASGGRMVFT